VAQDVQGRGAVLGEHLGEHAQPFGRASAWVNGCRCGRFANQPVRPSSSTWYAKKAACRRPCASSRGWTAARHRRRGGRRSRADSYSDAAVQPDRSATGRWTGYRRPRSADRRGARVAVTPMTGVFGADQLLPCSMRTPRGPPRRKGRDTDRPAIPRGRPAARRGCRTRRAASRSSSARPSRRPAGRCCGRCARRRAPSAHSLRRALSRACRCARTGPGRESPAIVGMPPRGRDSPSAGSVRG
jgi:hypothetical protein